MVSVTLGSVSATQALPGPRAGTAQEEALTAKPELLQTASSTFPVPALGNA